MIKKRGIKEALEKDRLRIEGESKFWLVKSILMGVAKWMLWIIYLLIIIFLCWLFQPIHDIY